MDSKLKHLEFIQTLINRLNGNGFLVKGWAVTLVAALFALAAKDANSRFILITYLSTFIFWLLDAYYLSQERQYRCLYNEVANRSADNINFSMNARAYSKGKNSWHYSILATTLIIFYGALLMFQVLLVFIFSNISIN